MARMLPFVTRDGVNLKLLSFVESGDITLHPTVSIHQVLTV